VTYWPGVCGMRSAQAAERVPGAGPNRRQGFRFVLMHLTMRGGRRLFTIFILVVSREERQHSEGGYPK
jgi:hypothetical protein